MTETTPAPDRATKRPGEVLRAFAKLGVTSFGGPIAHLGYFRDELVVRRRWVTEREYADLVALCQALPGPTSSQLGFALGLSRGGMLGAIAAFVAFTLPSAALMVAFAFGAIAIDHPVTRALLDGLGVVAVAIVAHAVWGMARVLTPDVRRILIGVAAGAAVLLLSGTWGQLLALAIGAVAGVALCRREPAAPRADGVAPTADPATPGADGADPIAPGVDGGDTAAPGADGGDTSAPGADGGDTSAPGADGGDTSAPGADRGGAGTRDADATTAPPLFALPRAVGVACLALVGVLLVGLPLLATLAPGAQVFDAFFRSGALVFGGGHVVLPLLQTATVDPGWVSQQEFLAGYGAAQAVPGPLFSFAGYLGAVLGVEPTGVAGAAVALVAIFLPGFLLLVGVLPFWEAFTAQRGFRAVMRGANAAVVGILAAALVTPIATSALTDWGPVALALVCLALLVTKVPPWLVVLAGAAGGVLLAVLDGGLA